MMFNMPGPAIVPAAGKTNPAFVHDAFNTWVMNHLPMDGFMRSWHMPSILADIVAKVRKTTDP